VSEALVSQIDLYPTICELLGLDCPDFLQGRSILPVMRKETQEINDAVFAELTYHAAYEPQRAIRTKRYKYIRRFGDRELPVLANIDDGPTKDLFLAEGWGERALAREALYDLLFDPAESHNLADDAAHVGVLAEMQGRLEAWMRDTDDPLLDGDVDPPPGAVVNDQDAISASDPHGVLR
jgi:arylsulfatase A-like enzyme